MSYKDTKIFRKDFGDGGREARLELQRIADRKERRFNRGDVVNTTVDTPANIDTDVMECNGCGYIGYKGEDFTAVVAGTEGDYNHECPVCNSIDCIPYVEEDI
jgi:rubredoxin